MSDEPQQKRPRRTGWRRILPTWRMLLGGLLLCAFVLVLGFVVGYKIVDIPAANVAATAQSNVYLYADGTQIARDGEVNRENIKLAQVPMSVQRAVLAAEDRDFYNEPAVDPQGMIRAAWNTATGKGTQGGSTITQQYVKNYYLGQEQTIVRKTKEFFIAIKLNREQSKGQILQGYLNTSYFGRNAYGIQAAAQAYYGKNASDLSTAEGAYLASLLNAPSEFDVVLHPGNKPAAVARWNYVLDGMVKEDWLSPAARDGADFPVPGKVRHSTIGLSGQRGYVVQAVEDVSRRQQDHRREDPGLRRLPDHHHAGAEETERPRQGRQGPGHLPARQQTRARPRRPRRRRVHRPGIRPCRRHVRRHRLHPAVRQQRHPPRLPGRLHLQTVRLRLRRRQRVRDPQRPTYHLEYRLRRRQPPHGRRPRRPHRLRPGERGRRRLRPHPRQDRHRQVRQRRLRAAGPGRRPGHGPGHRRRPRPPRQHARPGALSLHRARPGHAERPGHGRGVRDTRQSRHACRYSLVTKVSKNGTSLALPRPTTKRAVSREAADTTTSILQSVVESGTGTAAGAAGRPAAGKTGTAEDDKAAWFAGYTPDLTTVVAIMGADPKTARQKPLYGALGQARINGGGAPAQIWGQYTAAALRGTAAGRLRTATGGRRRGGPTTGRPGVGRTRHSQYVTVPRQPGTDPGPDDRRPEPGPGPVPGTDRRPDPRPDAGRPDEWRRRRRPVPAPHAGPEPGPRPDDRRPDAGPDRGSDTGAVQRRYGHGRRRHGRRHGRRRYVDRRRRRRRRRATPGGTGGDASDTGPRTPAPSPGHTRSRR